MLLYAVDSAEGYQIGNARGDDSQADEPGEGGACHIRVLEPEEADEDGSGDAEQERGPPGQNNRQGYRHKQIVSQEDDAEDNLQDGGQHAGAAIGKISEPVFENSDNFVCFWGRYAEQEQYRRTVHRFDGDIVWRSGKLLGVQSATINPLMLMLASDALTGV